MRRAPMFTLLAGGVLALFSATLCSAATVTGDTQLRPQPTTRREPSWEQSLVSGAGTGLPACPLLATLTLGWTSSTGSQGTRAPRGPAVQGLLLK